VKSAESSSRESQHFYRRHLLIGNSLNNLSRRNGTTINCLCGWLDKGWNENLSTRKVVDPNIRRPNIRQPEYSSTCCRIRKWLPDRGINTLLWLYFRHHLGLKKSPTVMHWPDSPPQASGGSQMPDLTPWLG
jgi:hypothetical protein